MSKLRCKGLITAGNFKPSLNADVYVYVITIAKHVHNPAGIFL